MTRSATVPAKLGSVVISPADDNIVPQPAALTVDEEHQLPVIQPYPLITSKRFYNKKDYTSLVYLKTSTVFNINYFFDKLG